jgi:high-affinity Fe2+/Pb2+ permease
MYGGPWVDLVDTLPNSSDACVQVSRKSHNKCNPRVSNVGVLPVSKPAPISRVRKVTSYLSVTHSGLKALYGGLVGTGRSGTALFIHSYMGLVPVVVAGCWSQCPARRPGRLRGW